MSWQQPNPRSTPSVDQESWADIAIGKILFPATQVLIYAASVVLLGFYTVDAFLDNAARGVRTFAAILLPLVAMTYIVRFQDEVLRSLGRAPRMLAFVVSLLVGMGSVCVMRLSGSIPIAALIVSMTFSMLLATRVQLEEYKSSTYFFGVTLGALAAIVLFGVPSLPASANRQKATGPPLDWPNSLAAGADMSAAEIGLRDYLSSETYAQCFPSRDAKDRYVDAAVLCKTTRSSPKAFLLVHFIDDDARVAATKKQQDKVASIGGLCGKGEESKGTWNIGGINRGGLVCYKSENGSFRIFAEDSIKDYGLYLEGSDPMTLYRWWTTDCRYYKYS
ncbi:hypothetical protein [Actinoplanes sp. NPDC049118]|uniref:hypothetical protein n=1 Tax=Actinoplanes sp. NPDC049118 TaxID=3155769 RepID=UPI0034104E4C